MEDVVIMNHLVRIAKALGESPGLFVLIYAVVVILLLMTIWLFVRVRRLSRRRTLDISEKGVEKLARAIGVCTEDIQEMREELGLISSKLDQVAQQQLFCVQRMGFVRFDAFDDVGGEQSFALALLDANYSGVVVSNIYSRRESRVYAKQVSGGNASHALSHEEEEAIRRATT